MRRRTFLHVFYTLTISIQLIVTAHAQEPIDIKVIATEMPPLMSQYLPNHGQYFAALNNTLENTNINIVPVFMPPARAAYHSKASGISATMFWHRLENISGSTVHFSLMEGEEHYGLLRKRRAIPFKWNNVSDLSGMSLGLPATYKQSTLDNFLQSNNITLTRFETNTQALQLLLSDRLDALAAVERSAWWAVKNSGLNSSEFEFAEKSLITYRRGLIWIQSNTIKGQLLIDALVQKDLSPIQFTQTNNLTREQ